MMSVAIFVLGMILASFMGVVASRLHTGQSFLVGRSRCDACGAELKALSLIPIVSFFVTRGRARCCGARISPLAPLTELILGLLYLAAYERLGLSLGLLFLASALALLLGLVLYDVSHQILPPLLLYPFIALSVAAASCLYPPQGWQGIVVVALLLSGSLAAIHYLSRGRAMGLADAPLTFGLALLVGPVALTGFVFSFWIGAVVGIALLARRPRGSRMGVEVPFAPFLACGFLLAYFTQWNLFAYLTAVPH